MIPIPSRVLATSAAALVAVLACVTWGSPAQAVGTGDPEVVAVGETAKHYSGFTGPFVVSFENAPKGSYSYYVATDPPGGTTRVIRGPFRYTWTGSGANPQFKVASLEPGAHYRFHVGDKAGHAADVPFAVSSGTPPSCSIVLPNHVRVKATSEKLIATLAPNCKAAGTGYASWQADHAKAGFAQTFIFDGSTRRSWRLYDDEPTGLYVISPNSAKTKGNVHLPQNTRRMIVRLDSRVAISARRSGSWVTVATSLRRYSPGLNRFGTWAGHEVTLSYRTCPTCSWHTLKTQKTTSKGRTSYRYRAPKARMYRVTSHGTSTTWAPVEKRVHR
ncbi:MAG: hypothetical protein JWQ74_3144 [Marmoricola sp.]|nr:hypothetical protein [Marmoricola sp.]